MNTEHPIITEIYAAKQALSKMYGPSAVTFASHMRKLQAESKKRGIKFVDLSNKGPSAYAERMGSGPLPKNYWKRKPVRPFIDPIEEEIKTIKKQTALSKRKALHKTAVSA